MSLRFFIDQCVPHEIIDGLEQQGHALLPLREHLSVRAPDRDVIDKARELEVLLLSLNGDFADITAYPPVEYAVIIAIQLHNHPEIIPALMETLETYLAAHPDPGHYRGELLLVEVHRIRVRGASHPSP